MTTEYTMFEDYQEPENTPKTKRENKATKKQIQLYLKICGEKKLIPQNYTKLSFSEMDKEIKRVMSLYPATEKQLEMIKNKIQNLTKIGVKIKPLSEEKLKELTGGKNGTASALIQKLIEIEGEYNSVRPASDMQIEQIVKWYICPDVPWEDYNVERYIELEDGFKRKMTLEEFECEIRNKFTYQKASKFIDKNNQNFFKWNSTRIKKGDKQWNFIRKLEADLTDTYIPKEIDFDIDEDGQIIQISKSSSSKQWNPIGFTPLSDTDLSMFDKKSASNYIQMLRAELRTKLGSAIDTNDMTFENLRITLDDLTEVKTSDDVKQKQFELLNDIMFSLETIAGYEDEELHGSAISLLLEDTTSEKIIECKRKIRGFMLHLLETEAITFGGLANIVEKCSIAQDILLNP